MLPAVRSAVTSRSRTTTITYPLALPSAWISSKHPSPSKQKMLVQAFLLQAKRVASKSTFQNDIACRINGSFRLYGQFPSGVFGRFFSQESGTIYPRGKILTIVRRFHDLSFPRETKVEDIPESARGPNYYSTSWESYSCGILHRWHVLLPTVFISQASPFLASRSLLKH